ncbi:transcriptional regulator [Burkholderia sp. TSV86]|uniref:transcriptional regulator n=1 Tax=Burkholderia sp. TSV86 TaxID=1385594 RepID=UPI0007545598|nr:YdaS family helix-turn-helix protein [Burkholderia sp. TSV86]KVE34309.1 hypothetical protein WS68_09515 [Burkholderia sp. TSV86]
MNKLLAFINGMAVAARANFCARIGASEGYLRKAISVGHNLGAGLCVRIERESSHEVTRRDLRPDDWQDIWPELTEQKEVA